MTPLQQTQRPKPSQVDVLTFNHILFYGFHNGFHDGCCRRFFNSRLGDEKLDDVGFGHINKGLTVITKGAKNEKGNYVLIILIINMLIHSANYHKVSRTDMTS